MKHESVEATGAKPGDLVRCIGSRDPIPSDSKARNLEVDTVYTVTEHNGRPAVRGIYFGLGFYWEKVEP